jgi:D-xylose 1-dehydrogenase
MSQFATYPSLVDKAVFITGGATGIGAALVEGFARQGARVGFVDTDEAAGTALTQALDNSVVATPWFACVDVTDLGAFQAAIGQALDVLGPFFVLINNVANDTRHTPQEVTAESWRECMAVNLDAAFFASQAAAPGMQSLGGGSIINFSSINALLGPPEMPGYVTAKAGLIGMTRALARDYGEHNIRVNAIAPGWVVTERQLATWLTPEAEAQWMEQVALGKRLMPDDVARLALFLASDDSSMITAQSLTIDGGRT